MEVKVKGSVTEHGTLRCKLYSLSALMVGRVVNKTWGEQTMAMHTHMLEPPVPFPLSKSPPV